jgi:hypothetical protein
MAIIQPGQTPLAITIWVKDVSDQGIGFTADRRLLTGQKIAIWVPQARSDPLRILAEVRNCREVENNLFSVGALFIHMSPVPRSPEGPAASARAAEPVAAGSSTTSKPAASSPPPASTSSQPAAPEEQVAAIRRAIFG